MSQTLTVPRALGGTLIIQYTPFALSTNAVVSGRKGSATLAGRKGEAIIAGRKGSITLTAREA